MVLVATRPQERVIIDSTAGITSEAHVVQVMLFLQVQGAVTEGKTVTGEVRYSEEHTAPIAAGAAGKELGEMVEHLTGRLTAKTPPRKVPSTSERRSCPIPREYCPERVEP